MRFLLVFILLFSFTNLFAQDTEEAVSDISDFIFTEGVAFVEKEDGTKGLLTEEGEFISIDTLDNYIFYFCGKEDDAEDDTYVNYLKECSRL